MSKPPEVPMGVLDEMRHCIHSKATCSLHNTKMLPEYLCNIYGGRLCVLYVQDSCTKYEQFPERYNT